MKLHERFLPGFNILRGRAPKCSITKAKETVEKIRKRRPGELHACFGHLVDEQLLRKNERKRGFDADTIFWAFLGQTIRGGSCRDGLLEVQAARDRAGLPPLSSSTSGYCKARKKHLFIEDIKQVHTSISERLVQQSPWHWNGRDVYAIDGTGVSLADTAANQAAYPQPGRQKPGCGFPVIQLVGLFHIGSGALCHYESSPLREHETTLFNERKMMSRLKPTDVLVADRIYCNYLNMAQAIASNVDIVSRLHQARKAHFPKGCNDIVVTWKRPKSRNLPDLLSQEEWEKLPERIFMRYLRIYPGGKRSRSITIATTLLDDSFESIAQLYELRWRIELGFRDIKITLGMDHLMVRSPDMAHKTIAMHMISYNLVRWVMLDAAREHGVDVVRLSFKGSVATLLHWKDKVYNSGNMAQERSNWKEMLRIIAQDLVPFRPHRSEPRCKKRRPKNYQLMTRPRSQMKVTSHRGKTRREAA